MRWHLELSDQAVPVEGSELAYWQAQVLGLKGRVMAPTNRHVFIPALDSVWAPEEHQLAPAAGLSQVFDKYGAGVEEIESLALGVVMRGGRGLRGDHGEITAGGCRVGETGGQQCRLGSVSSVLGCGRGTGELSGAVGNDFEPGVELAIVAAPDLDPWRGDRLELAVQGQSEDILECLQPVAAPGQALTTPPDRQVRRPGG